MKKAILKNLMILSFAFGGLFLVGNNVFADPAVLKPPDDQSGGAGTVECQQGGTGSTSCSVTWTMGFLGFTFSGGCSTTCSEGYYACCNAGSNSCDCIAK